MKKFLRYSGFAFIGVLAVLLILAFTQPKDLVIERTIKIKAPQATVFNQIKYFKNWVNWSPWVAKEPTLKLVYLGDDGMVNSGYHWNGDEMGEGEMINSFFAENGQLNFNLKFIQPWEGSADGYLKTMDIGNGEVEVKWNMISHGSFPMNALNYLTEYFIGNDFRDGLQLLKDYCEAHPLVALSINDVKEVDFKYSTLATIRKKIAFSEMQAFSTEAYGKLATTLKDNINGPASSIFYDWDDKNMTTDMAPAFAVKDPKPIAGIEMVSIPDSKSCQITYKGGYSGLGGAHMIMSQYIAQKGKNLSFVIEQYIVGPANTGDSTEWATNIVYVYK